MRGDCIAFLDEFTQMFFAPGGEGEALVSEPTRLYHREIVSFASPKGTLECIEVFGRTDFREDLAKIDVPTLIIHGDSDAIVPFEVSGHRSHQAIPDSSLTLIEGVPYGLNTTPRAVQPRAARLPGLTSGRKPQRLAGPVPNSGAGSPYPGRVWYASYPLDRAETTPDGERALKPGDMLCFELHAASRTMTAVDRPLLQDLGSPTHSIW